MTVLTFRAKDAAEQRLQIEKVCDQHPCFRENGRLIVSGNDVVIAVATDTRFTRSVIADLVAGQFASFGFSETPALSSGEVL